MSTSGQPGNRSRTAAAIPPARALLDVALGMSTTAVGPLRVLGRRVNNVARPVVGVVLRPPLVPADYQPGTWLSGLARRGERRRDDVVRELVGALDVVVPVVVDALLRRFDVTETVRRHVDLDALVAEVDLDAAAHRLDVDAVATRLDVAAVLDRLDLTELVRERVDLDALVAGVDLNAAAARLDVAAVLDRLDLTALVRDRVDLDALVAGVDIDAIISRIDLAGLAEEVIAEIDLPEIIRESTGSVASDTIRGVRMQGISGDEALTRAVHRLRLRRNRRGAGAALPPGEAMPPADALPPRGASSTEDSQASSEASEGAPRQPGVTTRQP